MADTDRETWTLAFRPEGAGPPVQHRVRRLLKAALRSYGLRCTRLDGPPAMEPGTEQLPARDKDGDGEVVCQRRKSDKSQF